MNDIDNMIEAIKKRMNMDDDIIKKLISEEPRYIRLEEYYRLDNENTKLLQRIYNAIKYIEDNSTKTHLLKSFDIDMLLDILKGEDNE